MSKEATPVSLYQSVRDGLREWFTRSPGRELLQQEIAVLDRLLPDMFGYHCLQLGVAAGADLLQASRIGHRILVRLTDESAAEIPIGLHCDPEYLPFAADAVDVVVLPHVLEFTQSPHKLLREVERILIGEGHLVITGFNPWSLLGIWKLLLAWREVPPWCGHFFSLRRLRDWLTLLDLEVVHTERRFYRPPFRRPRLLERLAFMDKLGRFLCPPAGGVYIIVARKRVVPLTPVRDLWQRRRQMIKAGVVEPSTRNGV